MADTIVGSFEVDASVPHAHTRVHRIPRVVQLGVAHKESNTLINKKALRETCLVLLSIPSRSKYDVYPEATRYFAL